MLFPLLPCMCRLSAPSRTACFVNESPLAEVRPAPHVTPALPQLQASPPTRRARSPGFGDRSAWAPPGRGRSFVGRLPILTPRGKPSPFLQVKERRRPANIQRHCIRGERGHSVPEQPRKGPCWTGRMWGSCECGSAAAGRQDTPSPKEAEGPSRRCSLGGRFGRGRGTSGVLGG